MFHPLCEDLKSLKVNELESKIQELSKKYFLSLRYNNSQMSQQILLLLNMYKEEQQKREAEMLKKTLSKTSDLKELIKND
jgi:hypothetical protein